MKRPLSAAEYIHPPKARTACMRRRIYLLRGSRFGPAENEEGVLEPDGEPNPCQRTPVGRPSPGASVAGATIRPMSMRERRAAHVRPRQPSSDRLRSQTIRAAAPSQESLRRYRPVRTSGKMPVPIALALIGVCLVFGFITLSVGAGVLSSAAGQLGGAIGGALSKVSSQSLTPATAGPSGVALNTPVFTPPNNQGFTNQPQVVLAGSVPGGAIGKSGYIVRIFTVAANGAKSPVADVPVGQVSQFQSPALNLVEGANAFVAVLVTPTGEGASSPPVVYTLDTKAPAIKIASPANNSTQTGTSVHITGTTDAGATVTLRNPQAPGGSLSSQVVGGDGKFDLTVAIVAGSNAIQITSTDQAGNSTTVPLTLKRDFGQLAVHLSVNPSKFSVAAQTTIKLTAVATSANGGPLAGASVTFTLTVQGLGPITPASVTTDATGSATFTTTIAGAAPGSGLATVQATSSTGDSVTNSVKITTTP